ncbi:MAG TPA: riboflavin synthase [Candidatus Limnocylindria bacterium]|jgi:riboflavin synthase|nr:riboflavin synthase [Candidatus Limnocylindria bacterium]
MFTGIVSAVAKVVEADGKRIGIDHAWIARHLKVGGSVAVNGCCLTVVKKRGPVFFADVVPETLRRTNLGALRPGVEVNLELPLGASSLLDGHLVQGHIDATASVKSIQRVAPGREVIIELPATLARFVAVKGSIAVDGVSLTVATVDKPPGTFGVALIPHTLEATIAGSYKKGSVVNLEADVIARYVARNLRR